MTENTGKLEAVISAGSDLAGAAIGGALGFIAGGPVGAATAGALGVVITRVGKDVATRFLSDREEVRVGAAAAISINEIRDRLSRGDKVRSDDFFESKAGERSKAEEIFEGTLLASKNSHEEKKVRQIAKLFSNVAFDETCESNEANYSLHIAELLTYSQLVLMQIFSLESNPLSLKDSSYNAGDNVHYATISLLQATKELADLQLVRMQKAGAANGTIILGLNGICPADLKLTVSGERIRNLLSLSDIEQSDLLDTAKWLR
jgi:hypothetical protein